MRQEVPLHSLEEKSADNLQKISAYYLSGKHLLSRRQELARQCFLLFTSISGGSIYFNLAKNFTSREGDYIPSSDHTTDQWILGLSVPITALAVLYNSTDIFFNQRQYETIPAELQGMLTPLTTARKRKLHDVTILIGSAVSAIPLTLVNVFYPLLDSLAFIAVQGIIVEFDNTVLHFLPLKLALMHPIYRFPTLPLELLIKKYCLANNPIQRNEEAEIIRQRFTAIVNRIRQELALRSSVFELRTLTYRWEFSQDLRSIMESPDGKDIFVALCQQFPRVKKAIPTEVGKWDYRLCKSAGFLGAGWIAGSLAGYLISPILEIFNWTGSAAGTFFIAGPPIYFFAVLLSFFGYNIGKALYQNAVHWGENDSKLPFELKLYPKFFFLMMVFNTWINLYSYAAAEELIHEWIPEGNQWAGLKSLLIWVSRTGVPLLCFFAIKDLAQTLIRKWAIHRGNKDVQLAAQLMTELDQLDAIIPMINPEQLSSSKQYLVTNGIIDDFGLPEQHHEQAEERREQPHANQLSWGQWLKKKLCFWCSERDSQEPLLPLDGKKNHQLSS